MSFNLNMLPRVYHKKKAYWDMSHVNVPGCNGSGVDMLTAWIQLPPGFLTGLSSAVDGWPNVIMRQIVLLKNTHKERGNCTRDKSVLVQCLWRVCGPNLNGCPLPRRNSKSWDKRFFIQDFVFCDTDLSVLLDLNLPCRHDFTALCKQRGERPPSVPGAAEAFGV